MTCSLCDRPAMRQGTKGRAYCFAHEAEAFAQVGQENRRFSIKRDLESAEIRLEWRRERRTRAV
jgi:hypothetical protein